MKTFLPVTAITILALLLRFVLLAEIPPSLSHDEVAIGYNAWSILQTGKDEYGNAFPVLFRSFDDYKLPGYIYLTALAEAIFGLTPFAVRFTSAFLGTLCIPVLYFLLRQIFKQDLSIKLSKHTLSLPLPAALILAISPWHINFSRAAFESNASTFFILAGTLFLFKAKQNSRFFVLSALLFAFSLYFYYTARVVVPAIVAAFLFTYRNEIKKQGRTALHVLLFFFLIILSLVQFIFTSGQARVSQVSIFESREVTQDYRAMQERSTNQVTSKLFYSDKAAYAEQFVDNYLKNFNLDYYFTTGTGPTGLLYVWEAPFFFLGIGILLLMKHKAKWVIVAWFFTVPIVGGLTMNQPNALRILPNSVITPVFTALGIIAAASYFRKSGLYKPALAGLGIIVIFFFLRFLSLYFEYYPPVSAGMWGDGHKEMALYVKENKNRYDNIYVSGANWRPYIYYVFYAKHPPQDFQANWTRGRIENIEFGKSEWDDGGQKLFADANLSLFVRDKTLFILTPEDFRVQQDLRNDNKVPYTMRIVDEIQGRYLNPAFYAIELQ